jgi:hypothetical protein
MANQVTFSHSIRKLLSHNSSLQPTVIPLRELPEAELKRWAVG